MGLGLNIGLNALTTAQQSLDTIGHNIANANTPGYSRQRLSLSTETGVFSGGLRLGAGVRADDLIRSSDLFVQRHMVRQHSSLELVMSRRTAYGDIESLLAEPGGVGLGLAFNTMFERATDLVADPSEPLLRTGFSESALAFTERFRDLAGRLGDISLTASEQAAGMAKEINALGQKIAELNVEIASNEAGGRISADLRDRRDEALQELAKFADITYLESASGTMQVQLSGQMFVGSGGASEITTSPAEGGGANFYIEGVGEPIPVRSGKVGGMSEVVGEIMPEFIEKLDALAREIILGMNREHTTGVPSEGGHTLLRGTSKITDIDGDGDLLDGVLSQLDIPFEISDGELYVHVQKVGSDNLQTYKIEIDAQNETLGDFMDKLDAVPGLSVRLDTGGHVEVRAHSDYMFDFSRRMDAHPDNAGSFGGTQASLSSSVEGPFTITVGDDLDLVGSAGAFTVTLDPASYANPNSVTAQELVDSLNADPQMNAQGMRAVRSGDRVVLQSLAEGSAASFSVTGGSLATELGFALGAVNGQDLGVEVEFSGSYSGSENERWELTAVNNGTIGTTAGLQVEVHDENGELVTTLEVGADYQPGEALEVRDGVFVSFSFGDISASDGDSLVQNVIADSDTSDVLVGLGIGSLLTGHDSATINVREDLLVHPSRLALSTTGVSGDAGTVEGWLDFENQHIETIDSSVSSYYASLVAGIGYDAQAAEDSLEVETIVMSSLEIKRDQVSGVNVDEELVSMIQFEQAYSAAAQYIQVVRQLGEELMRII